jgi:leader peptidase (prepilin peptidase)/N-methyltransferase
MTRGAIARDVIGFSAALAAALALLVWPEAALPSVPAAALALVALCGLAAWVAWQDLSDFTIPDGAVGGIAVLALADRFARAGALGIAPTDTALACLVDVALAGGGLWAVREIFYRRRGYDGLGFGDVKLAAAGSLAVGAAGFSLALLAASATGIALLIALKGRSPDLATTRLAFGAVLAPAVVLVRAAQAVPALAIWIGGAP